MAAGCVAGPLRACGCGGLGLSGVGSSPACPCSVGCVARPRLCGLGSCPARRVPPRFGPFLVVRPACADPLACCGPVARGRRARRSARPCPPAGPPLWDSSVRPLCRACGLWALSRGSACAPVDSYVRIQPPASLLVSRLSPLCLGCSRLGRLVSPHPCAVKVAPPRSLSRASASSGRLRRWPYGQPLTARGSALFLQSAGVGGRQG